jgi:esterase/lipase superfamily enzyme
MPIDRALLLGVAPLVAVLLLAAPAAPAASDDDAGPWLTDLTLAVESFRDLFDGHYEEAVYYHTPTHFLPNLDCNWRLDHLRRMDIVLVIGDQDPFLDNNRHLSGLLAAKGVPHRLHLWHGRAHRGRYWRQMAPLYV